MHFSVLKKYPEGFGRVGQLSELHGVQDASVETPSCLLYTRAGSVPHLTRDNLGRLAARRCPALFPLPSLVAFADSVRATGRGLSTFVGLREYPSFVAVQDPLVETPPGFNDRAGVSVWDRGGRVHLDANAYMRIVEAFAPSCYVALNDADTPREASKKRIRRSVERSLLLLDQCISAKEKSQHLQGSALLAAVQGGHCLEARSKSATETAKRSVDGFVLEGLHTGGTGTEDLHFEEVCDLLRTSLSALPENKVKVLLGAFRPEFVLKAAMCGVDVFDTSFANAATERGAALVFRYDRKDDLERMLKKGLFLPKEEMEIAVKASPFRDQFVPLLEGCTCYTCTTFTRGYVHHLLVTSELLGPVLLNLHNLHHFLGFFDAVRSFLWGYGSEPSW